MNLGDVHIYKAHRTNAIRQILRQPHEFPQLHITKKINAITELEFQDIQLTNYHSHSIIKSEMIA